MDTNTSTEERKYRITPDERSSWVENGFFMRYDVFKIEENDVLRQIADDIAEERRPSQKQMYTKTH